jgi:hypothetical protein
MMIGIVDVGMFGIGMFGIIGADVGGVGGGGAGPAVAPERPRLLSRVSISRCIRCRRNGSNLVQKMPHAIRAANTPKHRPLSHPWLCEDFSRNYRCVKLFHRIR